jgi:predicted DNA-binding transcriptional regulator AlpA
MSTIYIPTEQDIKRWIKEAVQEALIKTTITSDKDYQQEQQLLNRKEVAGMFRISLVTLHSWMNKGFPCHKQGGKVYFIKSEIMVYMEVSGRNLEIKS